ncbi:MAG: shikimate kinase [bacterium]
MKTNIILIGFMGAGKTEVGRILAKDAGLNFIDLDFLIETHEGMTISEIFKQKGEDYFRNIETEILREIKKNKGDILKAAVKYIDVTLNSENLLINEQSRPWVISTGGGMPIFNDNMIILKNIGRVIYLKADVKTIYGRIKTESHRPVLGKSGFSEKSVSDKLNEREKFYGKADIIIYTEGLTMHGIADEINIFMGYFS